MSFTGCVPVGSVKVYICDEKQPQRIIEGNLYTGRNLADPLTFITAVGEEDGVVIGFDIPWGTVVSLYQALGTIVQGGPGESRHDCTECTHCELVEYGEGGLYYACKKGETWAVINGQSPDVCPDFILSQEGIE